MPPRAMLFEHATALDRLGVAFAAVPAEENVAVGVEAFHGQGGGHEAFRLAKRPKADRVVDDVVGVAHPARVEDVLKVEGVLVHVPEAPLGVREERQIARLVRRIFDFDFPELEVLADRDEVAAARTDASIFAGEACVAEAVRADGLVLIERFGDRLPGRGPKVAIRVVAHVDVPAGSVHRHAVEAKARESLALGRLVETVSGGVVGDDAAVLVGPEVVHPRHGRVGILDDVLSVVVVEVAVTHGRDSSTRKQASWVGREVGGANLGGADDAIKRKMPSPLS